MVLAGLPFFLFWGWFRLALLCEFFSVASRSCLFYFSDRGAWLFSRLRFLGGGALSRFRFLCDADHTCSVLVPWAGRHFCMLSGVFWSGPKPLAFSSKWPYAIFFGPLPNCPGAKSRFRSAGSTPRLFLCVTRRDPEFCSAPYLSCLQSVSTKIQVTSVRYKRLRHALGRVRHANNMSPCDQLSQNLHTPKLIIWQLLLHFIWITLQQFHFKIK